MFYKAQPTYNPQKEQGKPYTDKRKPKDRLVAEVYGTKPYSKGKECKDGMRTPTGIINISGKSNKNVHPTQKPVALFEYLIKTYTNEKDLVLDNCIGSGTTALACKKLNRNFIGIELEQKYVDIANKRLEQPIQKLLESNNR